MVDVAQSYQDELPRIKKNIESAYEYFRQNYDRFNEFRKFVFQTSMSDDDIALLKEVQKPQLEFNILEAYVSRLRGEFAKQEPSISVRAADGSMVDLNTINLVESHMRSVLCDANNDMMEYDVYTDLLSGGFSVMKVYTDYVNPMSFNQNIYIRRVFDPTLCGFDPLARKSHKGDGRYCFELFPKLRDEFEAEYGKEITKTMKFSRTLESFNWSYQNNTDEIVLMADYFEKKKKQVKIVMITGGMVMTMDDYKKFSEAWIASGRIEQVPAIIGKPRWTTIETICRYGVVDNKILYRKETDYKFLPLVFADGNSVVIRNGVNGSAYQMTRPYVYHARGVQKLKNFAGQTLANELENLVMHKFMVAKDAIPADYQDAYINVQKANVLVYNAFKDNDPNIALAPPSVVPRTPVPPEVTNTFSLSDEVTQAILGSFDGDLARMNKSQLSGVAIQESITLSNSGAMPYITGFIKALNQVAQIIVDLIPKYYNTPRTIPINKADGSRAYVQVNQPGAPSLDYNSNALDVKVEAGINFSLQKSKALQTIISLMQASPLFAQFMNQNGLGILLDNIDIRGIDQLKKAAEQFMMQLQQQQAQQAQMAQQTAMQNPQMMKAQNERMKIQLNASNDAAKIKNDQAELQNDQLRIMADLKQSQDDNAIQALKAETERFAKEVDLQLKHHNQLHSHAKDMVELHHKLKGVKEDENGEDEVEGGEEA